MKNIMQKDVYIHHCTFFVWFLVKRAVLYVFSETTKKSATRECNFTIEMPFDKIGQQSGLLTIGYPKLFCLLCQSYRFIWSSGDWSLGFFFYKAEHICLMIRKKDKF